MNALVIESELGGGETTEGCHRRTDWTDVVPITLLVASIVGLGGSIAWPTLVEWVNRPRPGAQVRVRFDGPAEEGRPAVAMDYLFYLPEEYGRDYCEWPLVLFLHGAGERGSDLGKVGRRGPPGMVAAGRAFPFLLVSPQCPADRQWEPEALLRLIDHVAVKYRVDADRVYVTGFSMGGFGTWDLVAAAPGWFAAIAPLAGSGDESQAGRLAGVPIWAFHGALDQIVPLEADQMMVDAVRAAGGNARLTVYESEGHGIAEMTYAKPELWAWLLAQRRGKWKQSGDKKGDSAGIGASGLADER